jgi:hypothetical protein
MSEGPSAPGFNPNIQGGGFANSAPGQQWLFGWLGVLDCKPGINPIGEIVNFDKPMLRAQDQHLIPRACPSFATIPGIGPLLEAIMKGFQEGIPDHVADLVPADVRAIFGESDIHSDGAVSNIVAQAGLRNAAMNAGDMEIG